MKYKKTKLIIIGILIILLALAAWGPIMSQVEEPKFKVLAEHGAISIRQYEPKMIAEVTVAGERSEAIRQGFRILADFIFGNNESQASVSMTAPVTQQSSEKIAMTAPVTQEATANNEWTVHFVMPAEYTLETLPKPKHTDIAIKTIPAQKMAVIRFSGSNSQTNLEQHLQELKQFLQKNKLTSLSSPAYAFYNPPWTLPILRRNEIMIVIE